MNADGSGETQITSLPGHEYYPDISPSGKQIVFRYQPVSGISIAVITQGEIVATKPVSGAGKVAVPEAAA